MGASMPRSGYDLTDALPGSAASHAAVRAQARRAGIDPYATPRASILNAASSRVPQVLAARSARELGSPEPPPPPRAAKELDDDDDGQGAHLAWSRGGEEEQRLQREERMAVVEEEQGNPVTTTTDEGQGQEDLDRDEIDSISVRGFKRPYADSAPDGVVLGRCRRSHRLRRDEHSSSTSSALAAISVAVRPTLRRGARADDDSQD